MSNPNIQKLIEVMDGQSNRYYGHSIEELCYLTGMNRKMVIHALSIGISNGIFNEIGFSDKYDFIPVWER